MLGLNHGRSYPSPSTCLDSVGIYIIKLTIKLVDIIKRTIKTVVPEVMKIYNKEIMKIYKSAYGMVLKRQESKPQVWPE